MALFGYSFGIGAPWWNICWFDHCVCLGLESPSTFSNKGLLTNFRLMGQDEIYLEVIKSSGEGKEKVYAENVLRLLKRGKHWVLVTLLLSNVITNETLPIVLDRSLGGGWPAVVSSTALIGKF
jgi:hypothetical protein